MAAKNATAGTSAEDVYTAYQGPWWTEQQVADLLHADAEIFAEARAQRRVVGLKFSDGLYYYPARQFALKPRPGVYTGLKDVLDVLATGIDDPDTWITWLAGPFAGEGSATMWELLRAGRMDELLTIARHDAASWRS